MISVTGKLNKPARTFQAGESTGFSVGIGEQFYNRETKEKEWTNYKAVIFAKGAQVQFYQDMLVEGAIIELKAQQVQIKEYNGNYYIEMIECRLGYIANPQQVPKQKSFNQKTPPPQQQGPFQKPEQDKPKSGFDDFDDFDDGIPF